MDYYPNIIPSNSLTALVEVLQQELQTISAALNSRVDSPIRYLTAAPDRIYDGMLVAADGTAWNPGGGKGLYMRIDAAWVKL